MRFSASRRTRMARSRAARPSNTLMAPPMARVPARSSGGREHQLDGGSEAAPARHLGGEGAAAGRGQAIVARTPAVLGDTPVARDQAAMLEALERGVKRTLVHLEPTQRDLLDALADAPAMHRLGSERLEGEEVDGAP